MASKERVIAAAAGLARGRTLALWLVTVLLAVVCTVFFSLDTTAVLLTPLVVLLARRAGLPPLPFAVTIVWLANTASLLLPVSNLTNLLALTRLPDPGVTAFLGLTWPAAVACTVVTVVALALFFRRSLRGTYVLDDAPPWEHPRLLWLGVAVCALLGPAFVAAIAYVDPGNFATNFSAGAQFGYGMGWTLLLTYPLMVGIQLASARIGRTTGRGLTSAFAALTASTSFLLRAAPLCTSTRARSASTPRGTTWHRISMR